MAVWEATAKQIIIGDQPFTVHGISSNDPYFQSLEDRFEPDFEALARAFVRDDYVCIDIGANIGMKTLLLSQIAQRGRVIAVEAGPTIVDVLRANIARSGLPNITLVNAAVSDRDGTVHFTEDSAYGHIATDGVEVPAKTLADIMVENRLDRLDFVKIDVEGFEFPILKNAMELLNEHQPLVLFELNLWCQMVKGRTNPAELIEWVGSHFSHIHIVHKTPNKTFVLERVPNANCLKILGDVLRSGWQVIDLLVTNSAERLTPNVAALMQEIERLNADLNEARSELARLAREREVLQSERAGLLASRSWRLTYPMRLVISKLRG